MSSAYVLTNSLSKKCVNQFYLDRFNVALQFDVLFCLLIIHLRLFGICDYFHQNWNLLATLLPPVYLSDDLWLLAVELAGWWWRMVLGPAWGEYPYWCVAVDSLTASSYIVPCLLIGQDQRFPTWVGIKVECTFRFQIFAGEQRAFSQSRNLFPPNFEAMISYMIYHIPSLYWWWFLICPVK